ncbi:plasmid pRiA4b ORF-3 family protein [Rossellomorea vietnamensis]|uniref:plasmid pRiA4b ORF-3 family protein n=1 Tax=Rossellomorea vietnamensis TaxID=218284 RepID=UPI003D2DC567
MLNREDLLQNLINKLKTSDEYRILSPRDQKRLQSALIKKFQAPDLTKILPSQTNPQIAKEVTQPVEKKTFQLKISLKKAKPPIWRRVLIPNTLSLHELHQVIQAAMGWTNSHLYSFDTGHGEFEYPDEEYEFDANRTYDSSKAILGNVMKDENDKISYTYDFGDNWQHQILLEKISEDQKLNFPVCLKGKRNCPLEDSGGIHHYQHVLEVLSKPDETYERAMFFRERFEDHNPEEFDLAETNEKLKEIQI